MISNKQNSLPGAAGVELLPFHVKTRSRNIVTTRKNVLFIANGFFFPEKWFISNGFSFISEVFSLIDHLCLNTLAYHQHYKKLVSRGGVNKV